MSRVWKLKEGKLANTFAKILVCIIFHIRSIQRNYLPKCMEHNITKTSASEFWYESVNSSLEKLINMKKVLFNTRTVQIAKSPPNKSRFKMSLLTAMQMLRHAQTL